MRFLRISGCLWSVRGNSCSSQATGSSRGARAITGLPMTKNNDAISRRRILNEFGTNFFVEAAAGTGKTTTLVGRIVGMVRSGFGTLAQTVAVTFTEKAAGEMKLRLRLEIENAREGAAPDERARLDRAL